MKTLLLVAVLLSGCVGRSSAEAPTQAPSILMTAQECMTTCFPLKVRTFDPRATFGTCVCGECAK